MLEDVDSRPRPEVAEVCQMVAFIQEAGVRPGMRVWTG